jgi:hypothetical protein
LIPGRIFPANSKYNKSGRLHKGGQLLCGLRRSQTHRTDISTERTIPKTKTENSFDFGLFTYEPSVSLKITQPFSIIFWKGDKYAEKNARMQYEIEKIKYLELQERSERLQKSSI